MNPLQRICFGLLAMTAAAFGQQSFSVSLISEDAGIRTDLRPIPVGFYAPSVDKTFVCWMGANSHAVVKELNHKSNTWSADKIVGQSPFADKHNYPGLLRGADDRLYLFYGCHNSTLKMAISPKPLSIEGVWEDRFIPQAERASYPAPVITSEGVLYVFYRDTRQTSGHSDDRPYQFVKSTDNGKTWTRQMAIDPYPRTTDNMCEVYNGMVTYQPAMGGRKARIHIAWTIAGEKLGRHAHATYGRNVYYAYLNPENDHMYSIEGKDLGPTIDNEESDKYCLVLDTGIPNRGHLAGLQVSAHYRDNGFPLLHFDNRLARGISSATWSGTNWVFSVIAGGGEPRGLEKFGPDSFRVYRPQGSTVNIYATINGGLSWRQESSFNAGKNVDRCLILDNHHRDAKLLIMESGDGNIRVPRRDILIGKVTANFEPPYSPRRTAK